MPKDQTTSSDDTTTDNNSTGAGVPTLMITEPGVEPTRGPAGMRWVNLADHTWGGFDENGQPFEIDCPICAARKALG